ncbi:MAG: SGNH/GDSL hydrolase family protein [Bdellovibrionota bacterium]
MSIVTSTATVLSASESGPSLERVMRRPLIVGASVSADWASKSPGKLLALRYTDENQIKTIAFGGKSGSFVLKKVGEEQLRDRTVVIGLDLFFWDATLRSADDSLKEMKKLIAAVKARDIPIILGEVPNLLPGMQPQAALINRELQKACDNYAKCTVVPFTDMLVKVLSEGALNYKGTRYNLRQLIPDGLHIGPIASQYIADTLYETLNKQE